MAHIERRNDPLRRERYQVLKDMLEQRRTERTTEVERK